MEQVAYNQAMKEAAQTHPITWQYIRGLISLTEYLNKEKHIIITEQFKP